MYIDVSQLSQFKHSKKTDVNLEKLLIFHQRLRRNGAAALASAMKVWSRSEDKR